MKRWSRRAFLAAGAAGVRGPVPARAAGRGTRHPAPVTEVSDVLTERKLERLTDPAALFHLPHHHHRFLSAKGDFLLAAGEADGTRQLYAFDLRRERLTQLTQGPGIHPYSPTMDERGREFFFLQGNELKRASVRGGGEGTLFACPEGWELTGHLSVSSNSSWAAMVEIKQDRRADDPLEQFRLKPRCRIRMLNLERPAEGAVVVEERHWLTHPQFRPGSTDLLYAHEGPWDQVEDRLHLVSLDGGNKRVLRKRIGDDRVGHEYWTGNGQEVLYVHFPDKSGRGATVRAFQPDSNTERTVSRCSAFGWMHSNPDNSAIVGASRRLSGPNIYVLFTRLQREITLCEHLASGKPYPLAGSDRMDYQCARPETAFSNDSQWIFFVSDRDGKPAIYRMKVEDLVEAT